MKILIPISTFFQKLLDLYRKSGIKNVTSSMEDSSGKGDTNFHKGNVTIPYVSTDQC
jgi:hypothetical protein